MPDPILRVEGLRKSYGRVRALDGVDLEVPPGAVGLLGPNGAGKSTLIKALLGLVRVNAGRATLLGLDIRRDARRIRQQVGYLPEDDCAIGGMPGVSFAAYAGELYGLPPRVALRRAHEILDYVGVGEERYRAVESYSVGMRQKVKLAQALVHDPKFVLLDEPTSGLDPQARNRMVDLIRDLAKNRGISVMVSTHILVDVERTCSRAIILGAGRVLVHDALENLQRPSDASYRLRVHGDLDGLIGSLRAGGLQVDAEPPDGVRVTAAGGNIPARVFAAAAGRAVEIREIQPARNSLEDIFVKTTKPDA